MGDTAPARARRRSGGAARLALATALLAAPGPVAAQAPPEGPDGSAELAALAVEANPDIAAVATGIRALEQRVAGAGAWMDPVVSVGYLNMPVDRLAPGESPMSGIQIQLRQTFFWPGKIEAREEEAEALVRVQGQSLAERKWQLRAMVKRSYYRLALVRHLRDVTADHVRLLDQLVSVVQIRYEVGKVGQQDLLRLQVLRGKLADDLHGFERDDAALTAAINAALHRASGIPVQTPGRLLTPPPGYGVEQLIDISLRQRPLLRRYREQAAARRAAARRAEREGYPDLAAWVGYTARIEAGMDPGTDFVSLGLSVPLPLSYDRRWGSVARENELRAAQSEQEREAELDRIRAALGRVVAAWRRAAQEAATYRDELMPAAHRTLDATLAAYQVDRADFASLFQAELQLLDFERTIRRAEADSALARVETEALVGQDLE